MEYTSSMQNRLKRVEGQVRGVQKMMTEEQDCKDVVRQLSAARTAIDRTMALIVAENLEQCVREQDKEDTTKSVHEAIELLVGSR